MMRRCHSNVLSSLLCLSLFIMLLVLTKHVKQRFEEMQKFQRLQNYLGELNVVSESLEQLEKDEMVLAHDVDTLKMLFQVTSEVENESILEKPLEENNTDPFS